MMNQMMILIAAGGSVLSSPVRIGHMGAQRNSSLRKWRGCAGFSLRLIPRFCCPLFSGDLKGFHETRVEINSVSGFVSLPVS